MKNSLKHHIYHIKWYKNFGIVPPLSLSELVIAYPCGNPDLFLAKNGFRSGPCRGAVTWIDKRQRLAGFQLTMPGANLCWPYEAAMAMIGNGNKRENLISIIYIYIPASPPTPEKVRFLEKGTIPGLGLTIFGPVQKSWLAPQERYLFRTITIFRVWEGMIIYYI